MYRWSPMRQQAVGMHAPWPRQRQLHECLRQAIRQGTLGSGVRLPASRTLARELGIARNTLLYAYDQLASEGFVRPDPRGTVVAPLLAAAGLCHAQGQRPAPALRVGLSRRALALQLPETAEVANAAAAFTPGVPALQDFPLQVPVEQMPDRVQLLARAVREGLALGAS